MGDKLKGCRKFRKGTKDHFLIDKAVLKDLKCRKNNLAQGCIDYQKAYDLVRNSWILETMKLSGMANNEIRLMEKSIRTWTTRLECSGNYLSDVCIKRRIF